ncbi:hypothetical protein CR513_41187, partial [Mucuna pruriens]
MFQRVVINILLLDIPKYAKFLKELCMHKRKKMKGGVKMGGVVSALIKNEEVPTGSQQALPKKCRDPRIFSVPCTIGNCTFSYAMLDLGASIDVMPSSIYKSLNFGDLDPTGMIIQLANRSDVQPSGILEDVLVQVNELIFLVDFFVLDMKDETSRKGSTLILGQPFFMIAQTKINVNARTLSMEFDDNLVQFNIFEVMKHPIEDHSLFGIDVINELVEEYRKLGAGSVEISNFVELPYVTDCFDSVTNVSDFVNMPNMLGISDSMDNIADLADLQPEAESDSKQSISHPDKVGQPNLISANKLSPPHSPPIELKPLPDHLKYAYLDDHQHIPVIIANNLH